MGVRHVKVQEKLLSRDEALTLDIVMDIARTHEAKFKGETTISHIGHISHIGQSKKRWQPRDNQPMCDKCGRHHMDGCYPANGSRCHGCGQMNHCKSVCRRHEASGRTSHTEVIGRRQQPVERRRSRTKSRHMIPQDTHGDYSRRTGDHRRGSVHSVNQTTNNLGECFETLTFDDVVVSADTRNEVYATLKIKLMDKPEVPSTIKVKVNTGAQGNVLPLRTYRRMYPTDLDADGYPMPSRLEEQKHSFDRI